MNQRMITQKTQIMNRNIYNRMMNNRELRIEVLLDEINYIEGEIHTIHLQKMEILRRYPYFREHNQYEFSIDGRIVHYIPTELRIISARLRTYLGMLDNRRAEIARLRRIDLIA